MLTYMTRYTIVSNIITMFYARGIAGRIGDKVSTGAFVTDLIRPINLFTMSWQTELASICSDLIVRGLPIMLIFFHLLHGGKYVSIPIVLLAVILGHMLFLLIYSLLGFSTFILIEIWPFGRLLDDTIRLLAGGFIPLAILPPALRSIARALPFQFLYSFPLELLFGKSDIGEVPGRFLVMATWITALIAMNFRTCIHK